MSLQSDCADRGLPFKVIYWASAYATSTQSSDWHKGIQHQAQALLDVGAEPDGFLVDNWIEIPVATVPESTQYTFTNAALALFLAVGL